MAEPTSQLTDEQWKAIDAEIAGGKLIQAIILHRQFTGSDLKTAKDAVEARQREIRGEPATPSTSLPDTAPDLPQQSWVAIQQALADGNLILAVKLYRTGTGVGLKEAKDAMLAYHAKLRAEAPDRFGPVKSGCLGVVMVVGFVGLVGCGWIARVLG